MRGGGSGGKATDTVHTTQTVHCRGPRGGGPLWGFIPIPIVSMTCPSEPHMRIFTRMRLRPQRQHPRWEHATKGSSLTCIGTARVEWSGRLQKGYNHATPRAGTATARLDYKGGGGREGLGKGVRLF